jgi:hypothetical protein
MSDDDQGIGETSIPAFPTTNPREQWTTPGMTLRDWFAGLAMQVYISNSHPNVIFNDVAEKAYRAADAMLEERKR